jgi:predicted flap endonuclease-1-like 5' DNA nuclease
MSVIHLVFVLLGFVIGAVVAWALGAGASLNLAIGLLLVIAGGIAGFVVEWIIDESIRKNRELQHQLSASRAASALAESKDKNDHQIPQPQAETLAEIVQHLQELKKNHRPDDRYDQILHCHSETLAEMLHHLQDLKEAHQSVSEHLLNDQNNGLRRDAKALAQVLRQHKDELHRLGLQILSKDSQIETLRRDYDTYQRSHPDDLTEIKGIGPTYQRKLRDIGFSSFSQLADSNPAYIRRRLGIKDWQRVNIESWIEQARDRIQPL